MSDPKEKTSYAHRFFMELKLYARLKTGKKRKTAGIPGGLIFAI